ncbi:sulfite exporter TauE/SafE family protein [Vibrio paucivorans]
MSADWLAAFGIGLIGAGHCVGMCGGIASMLSLGHAKPNKWTPLFYNIGRLTSYMIAGLVVGSAVSTLAQVSQLSHSLAWLRLFSALFMIALALYIGRWWFGLLHVEKLGKSLWKYLSPIGGKFLPLRSPAHAIPFGFIWGWLPCGLVYSTLTWAAVSGSAFGGAMVMLSFGLGTLPAMLFVGYGAEKIKSLQQSKWFRNIGALCILLYGVYTAFDSLIILSVSF